MKSAVTVVLTCALASSPIFAAGAAQPPAAASLSGTTKASDGHAMARTTVRLRDVATGRLSGTTSTDAAGTFSFTGVAPGKYAVEIVNAAGQLVGTSAQIVVTAGAAVTGVVVTVSAAAASTPAAAAKAGAASASGSSAVSTALVLGTVAAAAGVAGIVVATRPASPAQ